MEKCAIEVSFGLFIPKRSEWVRTIGKGVSSASTDRSFEPCSTEVKTTVSVPMMLLWVSAVFFDFDLDFVNVGVAGAFFLLLT